MAFILLPGITNIPLWAKPETTFRDLFSRAVDLQDVSHDGPDLNHVLDDPDCQSLLDEGVFQSGLLAGNVLSLFDPARLLLIIISSDGQVHRFRVPAAATVRDAKQLIKRRLTSELRKPVPFELGITGLLHRPSGTARLLSLTRLPYQNVCFTLVPKPMLDMQADRVLSSNESIFCKHLRRDLFQVGVDRGCWRLVRINWPTVVLAVSAPDQPGEHFVRFRLDDYPANPPGIELWDEKKRETMPPEEWPVWFRHFISASYPDFVTVNPASYSPALLQLSLFIAKRKKKACGNSWNVSGDLTQCLLRITDYLSQPILSKDADVQRRIIRTLFSQQQSAGKPTDTSWLTLKPQDQRAQ